ncbi:MAG TPA: DUF6159 family protein [Xanthobacteraceae bacterium]|nr:DUF6159 family protein [Xanthobacteraceae bacterium]
MLGRIARGWSMAKASFTVLRDYPKLLVLPVLAAAALILALAVLFGIFMFEAGSFQGAGRLVDSLEHTWDGNKIAIGAGVIALAWLFTSLSLYFNAALVFCALRAFNGERPSIREGLATAMGRLPQIISWAFVAAVVGFIINLIQQTLKDKLGFLGSLLGGVFDFAWAAITYFVLPVLVVEGLGPVGAVKRSSSILKQTWGETATGSVGLGAIGFLLCLPAFLVIALGIFLASSMGNAGFAFVLFPLAFVYIVAVSTVMGTLGTVLQTGLYVYATTGKAPFDETLMRGAFQPKAKK